MGRFVALAVCGFAAASFSSAALAEDPVKPKQPSPATAPSDATQGGASTGGSRRDEDERKATESKEKAKKRPGYKDEAPSPRA